MDKASGIKSYYKDRVRGGAVQDFLYQVGKTQFGKPVEPVQLDIILNNITENLSLNLADNLLDLGCANGLLTYRLAPLVKSVRAVDLSADLLIVAQKHHFSENIVYEESDILELDFSKIQFNKIHMYEVLQHLPYAGLRVLLNRLLSSGITFSLFIGGIPDAERLFEFYNDAEKRAFYYKTLEEKQTHLGNWWYKDHIRAVCDELKIKCTVLDQPDRLYTAHYRFDCLLEVGS